MAKGQRALAGIETGGLILGEEVEHGCVGTGEISSVDGDTHERGQHALRTRADVVPLSGRIRGYPRIEYDGAVADGCAVVALDGFGAVVVVDGGDVAEPDGLGGVELDRCGAETKAAIRATMRGTGTGLITGILTSIRMDFLRSNGSFKGFFAAASLVYAGGWLLVAVRES